MNSEVLNCLDVTFAQNLLTDTWAERFYLGLIGKMCQQKEGGKIPAVTTSSWCLDHPDCLCLTKTDQLLRPLEQSTFCIYSQQWGDVLNYFLVWSWDLLVTFVTVSLLFLETNTTHTTLQHTLHTVPIPTPPPNNVTHVRPSDLQRWCLCSVYFCFACLRRLLRSDVSLPTDVPVSTSTNEIGEITYSSLALNAFFIVVIICESAEQTLQLMCLMHILICDSHSHSERCRFLTWSLIFLDYNL